MNTRLLEFKLWSIENNKKALAIFGGIFLVCCLILAISVFTSSLAITDNYVGEDVEEVPETVHTVDIIYSESATVTENTSLYDEGDIIENNALYPLTATDITIQITPVEDNATVESIESEFVYQGVLRSDTSNLLWSRDSEKAEFTQTDDGVEVTLPMDEIAETENRYERVYESDALVRPTLKTTISYTYEDQDTNETMNAEYVSTGLVQFTQSGYQITYENTRNSLSTGGSQPTQVSDIPLILVVVTGLLSGAGLIMAYRSRTISAEEVEDEIKQQRYNEWITDVESFQNTTTEIIMCKSLDDLVQLGIDSGKRPIHVEQTDEYFVIDNTTIYGFSDHVNPGQPPLSASFGMIQSPEQSEAQRQDFAHAFDFESATEDPFSDATNHDPFTDAESNTESSEEFDEEK